jgi:hypothetical protein
VKSDFGECETPHNGPDITCEEKGRKVRVLNPQRVRFRKIHVDGCVFTVKDACPRCDWLLIPTDRELEIYVELKGEDVRHAVLQIETTIRRLSGRLPGCKKTCLIAASHIAPAVKPDLQKAGLRFKKSMNADIICKSRYLEFRLP